MATVTQRSAFTDAASLNDISRDVRQYRDLDLFFSKNQGNGDVNKITGVEAVKRSIRNLVLLNFYEKPFNPERFWKYLQENFNKKVIRSKGLFWLASRPSQALIWSQAGGSLRAESAGVWWSSMTFQERILSNSFVENQEEIEKDWDIRYGDRKNEIVFIGKNMDQELITKELNMCLLNEIELQEKSWEKGYLDKWPVERVTNI